MKQYKTNLVYLDNIFEAIQRIQEYTKDKSFEEYSNDSQLSDAVHMRLQLIGENVNKLAVTLRDLYPDIPWVEIRTLRHIISHDYNILVPERIWETVQHDLPRLKATVERMIKDEEGNEVINS